MASMNGIELKAIKEFNGHDGGGYYQGNIYLDGKKIGYWSQDVWCGPDIFSFDRDENKFKDRIKAYYKKNPQVDELKTLRHDTDWSNPPMTDYSDNPMIEEYFMNDLLELSFREKEFKKYSKKGYKVMGVIDYYSGRMPKYRSQSIFAVDKAQIKFENETENSYTVFYESLDDFVI